MFSQFDGKDAERDAYVRPMGSDVLKNDFIATVGGSSGVKRLINCFQGCTRWLKKCINVLSGHVRNPGGHVIKNLSM